MLAWVTELALGREENAHLDKTTCTDGREGLVEERIEGKPERPSG